MEFQNNIIGHVAETSRTPLSGFPVNGTRYVRPVPERLAPVPCSRSVSTSRWSCARSGWSRPPRKSATTRSTAGPSPAPWLSHRPIGRTARPVATHHFHFNDYSYRPAPRVPGRAVRWPFRKRAPSLQNAGRPRPQLPRPNRTTLKSNNRRSETPLGGPWSQRTLRTVV